MNIKIHRRNIITFLRVISVILLMFNIILLFVTKCYGTYSWLSSSASVQGSVTIVSRSDIISLIEIAQTNPLSINLTKNSYLTDNITLNISISGEAANYVSAETPSVELTNASPQSINIITSITTEKYNSLISQESTKGDNFNIPGTITIKCFNEFINETFNIKFTSNYLISDYETKNNISN